MNCETEHPIGISKLISPNQLHDSNTSHPPPVVGDQEFVRRISLEIKASRGQGLYVCVRALLLQKAGSSLVA